MQICAVAEGTVLSRDDEQKLLERLRALGRPAAISELGDFGVHGRTLRRWLQRLCDDGRVRSRGVNRGRRYEFAGPPAPAASGPGAQPEAALASLLAEVRECRVSGRTAEVLAQERARRLAPRHRQAFLARARAALGRGPE